MAELDRIRVTGIRATGYHGVLEHERRDGQVFVADVVLHVDTREAAATDSLGRTVDYGEVAGRVRDVLTGPAADLIETVAERIAAVVLERAGVRAVDVALHKPEAPVGVPVSDVVVEIHRSREHPPSVSAADGLDALSAPLGPPTTAAFGTVLDTVIDAVSQTGVPDEVAEPEPLAAEAAEPVAPETAAPETAVPEPALSEPAVHETAVLGDPLLDGDADLPGGGLPDGDVSADVAAAEEAAATPEVSAVPWATLPEEPAEPWADVPEAEAEPAGPAAAVPAWAPVMAGPGPVEAAPGHGASTPASGLDVPTLEPLTGEHVRAVPPPPPAAPESWADEPELLGDQLDEAPGSPVEVVLALGSNQGSSQEILRHAVSTLAMSPGFEVDAVAPLARTAAVGGPPQPDFLNTVVLGRTTLSPRALLQACQALEAEAGRVRNERWGPRTLDVDIIVYGTTLAVADDLELPHPRAHQRAFVLEPWAQLAPDAVLPGLGGGPVAALAGTAPDREGIRWLALDWWTPPEDG